MNKLANIMAIFAFLMALTSIVTFIIAIVSIPVVSVYETLEFSLSLSWHLTKASFLFATTAVLIMYSLNEHMKFTERRKIIKRIGRLDLKSSEIDDTKIGENGQKKRKQINEIMK